MPLSAYDALIAVMAERIDAIDTGAVRRARDPLRAPARLLGHLAWSRGLDYWGEWSETAKRQLVNDTPANMRIRGTREAIDNALAAFAAELVIEEWWERDPVGPRGTATATVALGASLGADASAQDLVSRLLERESRLSVHWALVLGVGGYSSVTQAAYARVTSLYTYTGAIVSA